MRGVEHRRRGLGGTWEDSSESGGFYLGETF